MSEYGSLPFLNHRRSFSFNKPLKMNAQDNQDQTSIPIQEKEPSIPNEIALKYDTKPITNLCDAINKQTDRQEKEDHRSGILEDRQINAQERANSIAKTPMIVSATDEQIQKLRNGVSTFYADFAYKNDINGSFRSYLVIVRLIAKKGTSQCMYKAMYNENRDTFYKWINPLPK